MLNRSLSYTHSIERILLLLLAGTAILGQLARTEMLGGAFYLHEIFILCVIGVAVLFWQKQLITFIVTHTVTKPFVLFAAWISINILISFFPSTNSVLIGLFYTLRLTTYLGFGIVLIWLRREKVIKPLQLIRGLIASIAAFAVLGIIQYLFLPDTRSLQFLGWDDHYFRLISTLFDPGFTSLVVGMGLLLVQLELLNPTSLLVTTKWSRNIRIMLWGVLAVSLLLTYSRAGYLAYAGATVGATVLFRNSKHLIFLVLMLVTIPFLPRPASEGARLERTASAVARVSSVTSAFSDMSVKDVIIGKGWYFKKVEAPSSIRYGVTVPNHSSAPENSFVFVFTSLGIVGSVLFIYLGYTLGKVLRFRKEILVFAVALGIAALFNNALFYPFTLLIIVVIMGYSVP